MYISGPFQSLCQAFFGLVQHIAGGGESCIYALRIWRQLLIERWGENIWTLPLLICKDICKMQETAYTLRLFFMLVDMTNKELIVLCTVESTAYARLELQVVFF